MSKKTIVIFAGILAFIMILLWIAVVVCVTRNVRSSSENNETETEIETVCETTVETTTEQTTQVAAFNSDVPAEVWEELRQKTGLSEEEFAEEMKEYETLKDLKAYSWDNSEAPLTDEQIKEIKAEQESIYYALHPTTEATTEEATETTTAEQVVEKPVETVPEPELPVEEEVPYELSEAAESE